jgi:hypothetical protein
MLIGYTPFIQAWYQWAHFLALAIAAASAFWIFYDAAQRSIDAILWKTLTLVSVIVVLPSLVLWALPANQLGSLSPALAPLAYAGIGATAVALIALILQLAGVQVEKQTVHCPQCGARLHPSWEYCPYCKKAEAKQHHYNEQQWAEADPVPPHFTKASNQPEESQFSFSQDPLGEEDVDTPSPPNAETEILRKRPATLAWLVLTSGAHAGKEFRLGKITTIGRNPAQSDIVLDDNAVSRQHAKVKMETDEFVIYDLASTCGTLIKNQDTGEWEERQKHVLQNGDHIKMGREVLSFMRVDGGQD